MMTDLRTTALLLTLIIMNFLITPTAVTAHSPRLSHTLDQWSFHLGDPDGAHEPGFDDSSWRRVRVPHDWSVEHEFTQENAGGATGYLPGGVGWYRHTFTIDPQHHDRRVYINFDGVYNNTDVYINGKHLGFHPYGYSPFNYDLTEHVYRDGRPNVLAVRVDRSAYLDCRWYPGSGIYRPVTLHLTHRVHVPQWGVFVTTPTVSEKRATLRIVTDLANHSDTSAGPLVRAMILGPNGRTVAKMDTGASPISAGNTGQVIQELEINNPALWSPDEPNLYRLVTRVFLNGEAVDEVVTRFGIREIRYEADEGFFLNGKKTYFKGVCLHHDGGCVGAAVPKAVWRRRLAILREAGVNAIRTAHNPPSVEFLDLCDEMGFLVQDEAFDEWHNPKDKVKNYNQQEEHPATVGYTRYFDEWAEQDIKAMVLRDRNHPSIVMWSIGNEIEWTYPNYGAATGYWGSDRGNDADYYWDEPPYDIPELKKRFAESDHGKYVLAEDAANLARWVRDVDTSRPVTANLVIPSVGHFSGYTDVLDIVGYSYRQVLYPYGRKHYPEKLIFGSENWVQWHEWKAILDNPSIAGVFLWTGINYMGEARDGWPKRASASGMLDLAGFKRPGWHMFRTLWNDAPYVYMTTLPLEDSPYELDETGRVVRKDRHDKAKPKWGWHTTNEHYNYDSEQAVVVEAYTNCPEAELFLNGESLGRQKLADYMHDHLIKWLIPHYKPGRLVLKGYPEQGAEVVTVLNTALEPAAIRAHADPAVIRADEYEAAHIIVELADAHGQPVRHDDRRVAFHVTGPARLLGVDNGAVDNLNPYQSDSVPTNHGRALAVIQSTGSTGVIRVRVSSEGLPDSYVTIDATTGQ